MDTYKLVLGSVSTPLDNLLQSVRHTLYHVPQNLRQYNMNRRSQMQGGNNGVLLKEINENWMFMT
jgi:hypothetical protein